MLGFAPSQVYRDPDGDGEWVTWKLGDWIAAAFLIGVVALILFCVCWPSH